MIWEVFHSTDVYWAILRTSSSCPGGKKLFTQLQAGVVNYRCINITAVRQSAMERPYQCQSTPPGLYKATDPPASRRRRKGHGFNESSCLSSAAGQDKAGLCIPQQLKKLHCQHRLPHTRTEQRYFLFYTLAAFTCFFCTLNLLP